MAPRAAAHADEQDGTVGRALKRRGLIAGAAALVAGMVAAKTSQPVAAAQADYDSFFAQSGGDVAFFNTLAVGSYGYGVHVRGTGVGVWGQGDSFNATNAHGVQGDGVGTGIGVLGNGGASNGIGVKGVGGTPDGIGVQGNGTGAAPGVYGASSGDATTKGVQGQHTGGGYGVYGQSAAGVGVAGEATGPGVTTGVMGRAGGDTTTNTTTFPIGVRGSIPNTGYGVYGNAGAGYGVYGNAPGGVGIGGVGGTGVQGTSSANSTSKGVYGHHTSNGYGVYGDAGDGGYGVTGVATTSYGVVGQSTSGTGALGKSTSGVGVFGLSGGGSGQPYGVVGSVNSAPGFGLFGVANIAGTVGFAGGAGVAGAIAGQFAGPVNIYNNGTIAPGNLYIQGNYTASGTKSAAVPHPDGSHRLLYCMESPEAWFEDFGEGAISGGRAEVTLDADFAAVVDTRKLHVFLTAHEEHHLHVASRTATGFAVTAAPSTTAAAAGKKASDLSGTFSYRVVAKRKDVAAPRLAKFAVPQEIKAATPLVIPTLPKEEPKPTAAAEPPKEL